MDLISVAENSFINAEKGKSKLPLEVLALSGMTGAKTKHFYNNLLQLADDPRYLEIGTWRGSSTCAALYGNKAKITCIDNFSQFNREGDVKADFTANVAKYVGDEKLVFYDEDCFKIDISKLGRYNIYLYDGGHTYEDQYNALTYYEPVLDDVFIYIADDWNLSRVRQGTVDAIANLRLKVLWSKEIVLTKNDKHTPKALAETGWWNGIGIFVLQK